MLVSGIRADSSASGSSRQPMFDVADDDGVAQIDALAAAVGDPALVERLEEQVQEIRTRLLDLVEQDDRCRVVLRADWSGCRRARCRRCRAACRSACRPRRRRPGTPTCRRGPSSSRRRTGTAATDFRELGLADAGRSEEQQHAVGTIEAVLERSLVQHQAPRDRVDRVLLADDARLQRALRCP